MFCYQCGKELADHAVFCSQCGAKLTPRADKAPAQAPQQVPLPGYGAQPPVQQVPPVLAQTDREQSIDDIVKSVEDVIHADEPAAGVQAPTAENIAFTRQYTQAREIVPNYASEITKPYTEPAEEPAQGSNVFKIIAWVLIGLIFVVTELLLFLFVDFRLGSLFNYAVMLCVLVVCLALGIIVQIAFSPEKSGREP